MTLSTQFITMLSMIGMGAYFGAALDTYNRFLQRPKRKNWIVFCNDVLFWLLQGLIIFYCLFLINKGELRFYIFLALVCGFAAYQSLFKRLYLRILEFAIKLVLGISRFIAKLFRIFIYKPIRSLVRSVFWLLIMARKGLFALAKLILIILLFIIRLGISPIRWVLLLFWNILPRRVKKIFKKLSIYYAGYFEKITKRIYNLLNKGKKT